MGNMLISTGGAQSSPFADFANEVLRPKYLGQPFKYVKGEYLVGKDAVVMPIGSLLAGLMNTTMIGWAKWWEGEPVDHCVGLLLEGFKTPPRDTLGDNDSSRWELDQNGKPKDPWQREARLAFVDPKTHEFFTFLASSKGSIGAIAELCRDYDLERKKHQGIIPIIALESDSYAHKDRTIGRVKIPVLEPVDFIDGAPYLAMLDEGRGPARAATPEAEPGPTAKVSLIEIPSEPRLVETPPPPVEDPDAGRDDLDDREIPF